MFPWRSCMKRLLHLLFASIIWIYSILKLNAFKKNGSGDSIPFFLLISPALGGTLSLISECWVYTSKEQLKSAENAVILAHTDVTIGQRIINSISCVEGISYYEYSTGLAKSEHRPPLVIFHGYGTGKGVFAHSVAALAEHFHVYVLDTYGTGLSGGVPFVLNLNRNCSSCRRSISTIDDAELFYIEAVERWRRALNIEKFYLCGHSFGGYIASAYTLHYPDNILHLCLLSPVGFPKVAKLTQWNCLLYTIRFVWNQGYTVQHFFELLGPFSSYVVRKAAAMRFSMRDNRAHAGGWFDVNAFANYIFHSNVGPVSGNNGFPKLIGPGAYARRPMGERVAKLIKCPTTFAYGEFDWMDKKSGESVGHALYKRDIYSNVKIIPGVGHHVYLNKEAFIKTILELIQV